MSRFATDVEPLTRTEAHVLVVRDSGLSNREIAGALWITVGTVKCNLHRVYEKLQVRGRLEAVAKARDRGVLSLSIGTTAPVRAPVSPSKFGSIYDRSNVDSPNTTGSSAEILNRPPEVVHDARAKCGEPMEALMGQRAALTIGRPNSFGDSAAASAIRRSLFRCPSRWGRPRGICIGSFGSSAYTTARRQSRRRGNWACCRKFNCDQRVAHRPSYNFG